MTAKTAKNSIVAWTTAIALMALLGIVSSCGESSCEKFDKAMAAGNLSEAQTYLTEIDDRIECKTSALQLIRAYIEVGEADKAIHVYENITSWHRDRYDMKWSNGNYEKDVCRLLREYLVKNGEYERAWNYYPLDYDDENYIGNAQSRYTYLSDVVAAMCAQGKQDEARRFVEYQLRWFVTHVDSDSGTSNEEIKANFNSQAVREKLFAQIDNSYFILRL